MPTQTRALVVERNYLAHCEWIDHGIVELADGEILLRIDHFALTANNITYAAIGDQFGYWNFFPSGREGFGIVPVWGFATVAESKAEGIEAGERVYGYLPMASHVRVSPSQISGKQFVDAAAHRQGLALVYNQYHRLGSAAGDPVAESHRALFQILYTTSYLIERFLRYQSWFGAEQLVMTSASSKTALGLAAAAKDRSPNVKRIGLTSAGNMAFVEQTGLYDEIVGYDNLSSIKADAPTVSVDLAGNSALLAQSHQHFGNELRYSMLVGVTHVGARGAAGEMAGPAPTVFFAPTVAQEAIQAVGPEAFQADVAQQFAKFVATIGGSIGVEYASDEAEVAAAYLEALAGKQLPDKGRICRL